MKDQRFMRGWLQGFMDGEGCISFIKKENGHKQTYCRIYVGNTERNIMMTCAKYLTSLDIEFRVRTRPASPPRKAFYLLYISQHTSILRYAKLVGFASEQKTKTMNEVVEYINRGPMYPKKLMYDLYVTKKMSLPDICRHFGKHRYQQWYFSKLLKKYGIPTRTQSEAIKIALTKSSR